CLSHHAELKSQESLDHNAVELRPGASLELLARLLLIESGAKHPIPRHGVPSVRDGDDARLQGDLVPTRATRITEAVGPLVMRSDPLAHVVQPEAVQHARADVGMRLQRLP